MCVEWAEMNERGYFLKPDIVSDIEFRSKCMFGAEIRKEPIERAYALPDVIFRQQMHQKRLAAGRRPDPLGELKRSTRAPSRSGGKKIGISICSLVPIAGEGRNGSA